jgi:hypothetical protein
MAMGHDFMVNKFIVRKILQTVFEKLATLFIGLKLRERTPWEPNED